MPTTAVTGKGLQVAEPLHRGHQLPTFPTQVRLGQHGCIPESGVWPEWGAPFHAWPVRLSATQPFTPSPSLWAGLPTGAPHARGGSTAIRLAPRRAEPWQVPVFTSVFHRRHNQEVW